MSVEISVVVATHDRNALLLDLLRSLAAQTLAPDRFEVIVVDDGSRVPVRPEVLRLELPYPITLVEQANQGAATARHNGVLRARGDVIVVVDDDMRLAPGFLEEHLSAHARGYTLVLGHIMDEGEDMAQKPVFERMHARLLRRQWDAIRAGRERARGVHVCTGNVSFQRRAYLVAGGFDRTLVRSEDRELGVRLEKAGARLTFSDAARSVHRSDVADLETWMRRNFLYGVCDLRIGRRHADVESADPWRFLFLINPVSRALVALTVAAPAVGARLSRAAMRVSLLLDEAGAERAALMGTTLVYGLEYFRGVRHEAGTLGAAARDLRAYLRKRRHAEA